MPALTLLVYVGAGVSLRPPAPVTLTVQGSRAEPVKVTFAGQVTTVVELALSIVKSWTTDGAGSQFASPA